MLFAIRRALKSTDYIVAGPPRWQQFPSAFQESCIMICTLPLPSICMSSCIQFPPSSEDFAAQRTAILNFIDKLYRWKTHTNPPTTTFLQSAWTLTGRPAVQDGKKNHLWAHFPLIWRPRVQQDVWQLRLLARWSAQHHCRRAVSLVSSLAPSR